MSLDGKVAIVTGSARGLGEAVARGLAGRGANVLINYSRSKAEAELVVAELLAIGVDAVAVQGDVAEDADCRHLAAVATERWGRIDILINNAAKTTRMAPHNDLEALQAEDFIASYRVNVIGAYQMIRACAPAMRAQGYGAVVNISSVSSLNGGGSSVAYTASKGAMNTMSQSLARALGPEIRVNTVCPGFMATRWFTESVGEDMVRTIIEKQEAVTPLARAGTPDDIVPTVLFLAGEGAWHSTGAVVVVDAGFHLGRPPDAAIGHAEGLMRAVASLDRPMPVLPERMRALQVRALLPDLAGLAIADLPMPVPGPGEVLVRVHACAIGFPDLLMTHGGYQTKPELPFVGGMDAAGEVAALGAGVDHVTIGDAVIALGKGGGFAGYALYPAAKVFAKPAMLSMAEAAALGTAYLTAYVALVRCAGIAPGETLLVHGAAGGVGLAAVDLGLALGARVIAVASTAAKREALTRLHPAALAFDGSDGFREAVKDMTGGRGADVIFDPVGGAIFTESTRCIAFGGRLLIVGFAGGTAAELATNIALIRGFSVIGVRAGEYGRRFPDKGAENLAAILALAGTGAIRPHVHATLPMTDWRIGFGLLAGRAVIGRAVLVPEK